MQETAGKLRKEDREVGRGRKWRTNYRLLNQEVIVLEEEEKQLELVYPQVSTATNFCSSHNTKARLGVVTILRLCLLWKALLISLLRFGQECLRAHC